MSAGRHKRSGFKEPKPIPVKETRNALLASMPDFEKRHNIKPTGRRRLSFGKGGGLGRRSKRRGKHRKWVKRFMIHLARSGSIEAACIKAEVSRNTVDVRIRRSRLVIGSVFYRMLNEALGEYAWREMQKKIQNKPKGNVVLGRRHAIAIVAYVAAIRENR